MENKELKPKIRFKGFNGEWIIKNFNEFASYRNGKAHENYIVDKGKYIVVNSKFISSDGRVCKYTNSYLEPLKSGEIALVLSDVPNGKAIAKTFYVEKDGLYTLNQRIAGIGIRQEYDVKFVQMKLNRNKYFLQFDDGVKQTNLTRNDVINFATRIPNNGEEQKQIGIFFENIDKLINLNTEKVEKLKNIKTSFLSKMFPKPGSRVPELRFKGFSGEWTEYKLDECVEFRRGSFPQPYGKKEWYDGYGAMPFVQVVDVTDNMKLADDTKQKISLQAQPMSVLAKKGQVVVTLQGTIGRVAVLQYDAYIDRTLLIFENYNYDTDIDFFAYIIKNKFDEEAKKAPGGIIKTITKEALSSFIILLPSIEEQKAIAQFLFNLDKSIECQQQKLDKLKQIKESFLSKMFV